LVVRIIIIPIEKTDKLCFKATTALTLEKKTIDDQHINFSRLILLNRGPRKTLFLIHDS